MIRLSETKVLEDYFIDENGVITDINGVVQKTYLNNGRPIFKRIAVHRILMYTFYGYKDMDIHHIDENKLNNSLSNLVYLVHEEHARLHQKGKHHSIETKQKLSESLKGRHWNLSEETKKKLSESHKGKKHHKPHKPHTEETKQKIAESLQGNHWFNDGIKNFYCKECPPGCVKGRLIKIK